MKIDVDAIEGYNNAILIEQILPKEEKTESGIVLPQTGKPAHVFSRVLHVGWSCSKRLEVGDFVIAEKAMNTTLRSQRGNLLQLVRENDVIGVIRRSRLPPELQL